MMVGLSAAIPFMVSFVVFSFLSDLLDFPATVSGVALDRISNWVWNE